MSASSFALCLSMRRTPFCDRSKVTSKQKRRKLFIFVFLLFIGRRESCTQHNLFWKSFRLWDSRTIIWRINKNEIGLGRFVVLGNSIFHSYLFPDCQKNHSTWLRRRKAEKWISWNCWIGAGLAFNVKLCFCDYEFSLIWQSRTQTTKVACSLCKQSIFKGKSR